MATASAIPIQRNTLLSQVRGNLGPLLVFVALVALPFVIGALDGHTVSEVLVNGSGYSMFIQGLMVEVFILAVYAISYDLVLGITGLLSFGHAMFFAVGAYLTGVLLKTFKMPFVPAGWHLSVTYAGLALVVLSSLLGALARWLPPWRATVDRLSTPLVVIGLAAVIWGLFRSTVGMVIIAGVIQALLFGIVLARVKGITFALVTLGIASVFAIMLGTRELAGYTGADVGLQGIPRPDFLNPATQRLRFYFLGLAFAVAVYLIYKRFVNSPTGRVCVAIRENENRALMLGYNTFLFKLAALTLASVTAALAGCMHAVFKPLVSPEIAGMGHTVDALLIILIGGMGTLSGAMIGAALYRLLDYYLFRWFGASAGFMLGAIYVSFVLFVPYGIEGTWGLGNLQWKQGWRKRLQALRGGGG
jgi:branched-chain amino acid transport system permease protein